MIALQGLIAAIGRILLVAIFLATVLGGYIPKFNGTVEKMEGAGIPNAQIMLIGAIAFLLIGSFSVMLGFKARIGALLIAVFLCLATYYFHDFWNMNDKPAEQEQHVIHFLKNLSMLGAMIFIIGNGSGYGSVDRRKVTIVV